MLRFNSSKLLVKAIVLTLTFTAGACSTEQNVKIGMLAGLTGSASSFGISGRDGAILAAEEVNRNGGINGQKAELIIRDDKQNKVICEDAVKSMISQNVAAIVGPMTSSMAMAALPVADMHNIPMISPTASTHELAGKIDSFFRVIPISLQAAAKTAEYVVNVKHFRKIFFIYDDKNRYFTEPWFLAFKKEFEELNGGTLKSMSYTSERHYDFLSLAKMLSHIELDCLVMLGNGVDAAMLIQQIAKTNNVIPVIISEWSATKDIIEFGGKAVDGVEFFHSFDLNTTEQKFLDFSSKFIKRFGYSPNFASVYGYNAMSILLEVMRKGTTPEAIKKNLIKGSPYQGIQREIYFDAYGDVAWEYTLLKIQNGKFVTVTADAAN